MILLWVARLIVNFFTEQHQHLFFAFTIISLRAGNEHIMVGNNHRIEATFQSGARNILMRPASIGVDGVHVQINNEFVHYASCIADIGSSGFYSTCDSGLFATNPKNRSIMSKLNLQEAYQQWNQKIILI